MEHQKDETLRCQGCGEIIRGERRKRKLGEYLGPAWHSRCWGKRKEIGIVEQRDE